MPAGQCVTQHSTTAPGAGLCCQQIASGKLKPVIGSTVQVTDKAGHCGTCSVVASRSKKHAGAPVLKFTRGGAACPTTSRGCCALQAALMHA